MLQTQVLQSFTLRQNKGILRLGTLALGLGGTYGFFWHQLRAQESQRKFEQVDENIAEWKPTFLESYDAYHYPWAQENVIHEWEYKLVKLFGYFREERCFVKREKEGRQGYLVFAPFVTAKKRKSHMIDSDNEFSQSQLMVNLGWVPVEHKEDIEMGTDPLGTYEQPEDTPLYPTDLYTGFTKNINDIPEDDRESFVEFVGLVRQGEQENILRGKRNWNYEGAFNWIDLWYFVRLFRFSRLVSSNQICKEQARIAYIERVVPENDEQLTSGYPIPATKGTWVKPDMTPQQHKKYSQLYLASASLSILLSALTLRR